MTSEHRFEVIRRNPEVQDILANYDLLRRSAEAGRGMFRPLAKLGDLLDEVTGLARPREKIELRHVELADDLRWLILVSLIAALCLEWAFRKRKALV